MHQPAAVRLWRSLAVNVLDPRVFFVAFPLDRDMFDIKRWRKALHSQLLVRRDERSDRTGKRFRPMDWAQMHEGLFTRAQVPRSIKWHYMIFHEFNSFLLFEEEHIPEPPSRVQCYWLSCARHSKPMVDMWIDSLPWKVPPDRPWAGTDCEIVHDEIAQYPGCDIKWLDELWSTYLKPGMTG